VFNTDVDGGEWDLNSMRRCETDGAWRYQLKKRKDGHLDYDALRVRFKDVSDCTQQQPSPPPQLPPSPPDKVLKRSGESESNRGARDDEKATSSDSVSSMVWNHRGAHPEFQAERDVLNEAEGSSSSSSSSENETDHDDWSHCLLGDSTDGEDDDDDEERLLWELHGSDEGDDRGVRGDVDGGAVATMQAASSSATGAAHKNAKSRDDESGTDTEKMAATMFSLLSEYHRKQNSNADDSDENAAGDSADGPSLRASGP